MSKIAILLPTMGRADKLPTVLENIKAYTASPYEVYLGIEGSDEDTIKVSRKLGVSNLIGQFGSPAKAVNALYKMSREPFFIFWNDDFKATRDWDQKALAKMTPDVSVVALHDGNSDTPQWGTITLVRRKYIEEMGGTMEGPGTVYHEGYKHNYVDTEFWELASQRGVTAVAEEARINHIHPAFGFEADQTHKKKARKMVERDSQRFMERRRQYL